MNNLGPNMLDWIVVVFLHLQCDDLANVVGFARDAREERADVRLETCFNFNNLNLNLVIFCLNINLSIWPKSGLKVIFS